MDIERQLHLAHEIDSEAELETLETYEEQIHFYKNRRYTFIPMPSDNAYYNTEEGWVKDMNPDQYASDDTHLMEVLRRLQEQPFLLVDYLRRRSEYLPKSHVLDAGFPEDEIEISDRIEYEDEEAVELTFSQLEEYFPEKAEEMVEEYEGPVETGYGQRELYRYGIITIADVNRRPVKDMLYKVLSELSSRLSENIEDRYPDPESILTHMRPVTIGRWQKDRLEGLDLHIAEHMNLIEMMQVVQSSDTEFVQSCGFESKSDVSALNSINEIRNRVMHANRSLIYNRRDIQEVLDTVDRAQSIIANID